MGLRGESVGTAYVRIIADGSGLDRSIRDEFGDHDDAFDAAGRRGSKAYRDAFEDENEKAPNRDRLRESLVGGIAKGDYLSKEFFDGPAWKEFRKDLETRFGEPGKIAGRNLAQDLVEGMTFEGLDSRLDNITADITRATKDIQREEASTHADALRLNALFDKANAARQRAMLDSAYRLNAEYNRKIAAQRQADDVDFERHAKTQEERFSALTDEITRLSKGESAGHRTRADLLADLTDLRSRMGDLGSATHESAATMDDLETRLRRSRPTLDKFSHGVDDVSKGVSKAFGKGSRNDFLNFTGSVAGGLVRMLDLVPRLTHGFLDFADSLSRTFKGAGGGITGTLDVIGGVAIKAAAGVAILAVGIGGLVLVIGPLISILSLAAGVVVALAASISFALVGAVGALAGALLPLGAGLAVVIAAFAGLGKAQKAALKVDLRPLTSEFKSLGTEARKDLLGNVQKQARDLAPAIKSLRPLVGDLAHSLSGLGTSLAESTKTSGFKNFTDQMTKFLPKALTSLGESIGNTFGALGGIMLALLPLTSKFLVSLHRVTQEFNGWANSLRGQDTLKTFFAEAGDSAKDFGGFLISVTKLLAALISAGRATGDSLFASMSHAIDGWTKTLQQNPDILHDWFLSAERFGVQIGHVVTGVGQLFDALDSPGARSIAIGAFSALARSLGLIADVVRPVANLLDDLGSNMRGFALQAAAAAILVTRFRGATSGIGTGLANLTAGLANAQTRMATFGKIARTAAGIGGVLALEAASKTSSHAMKTLGDVAGGAAIGFSVGGPWGAAIGGLIGLLGSFRRQVGLTTAQQQALKNSAKEVAGTLDAESGAITRATRAAAIKTLADNGVFDASRKLGINLGDVTDAYLGNQGAINRVAAATKAYTDGLLPKTYANTEKNRQAQIKAAKAYAAANPALEKLSTALGDSNGALSKQRTHLIEQREAAGESTEGLKHLGSQSKTAGNQMQDLADKAKTLGKQHPKPQVTLNDLATPKARALTDYLNGTLGKAHPKPSATLNDLVTHAAKNVIDTLQHLNSYHASPSVSVNTNGVLAAISIVKHALDSIHDKFVTVHTKSVGGGRAPNSAIGGIFEGMRGIGVLRNIGEAGAEAVVPLDRPLSQVDPAVRALAAFAQGKAMASGGTVGVGKTVNVGGLTIYSPNADPRAVANEAINSLVARSI